MTKSTMLIFMKKHILILSLVLLFCTEAFSQNLVPSSGNNSITTCSGTIQDHAGSGNYVDNVNGYTVINPSVAGNFVRLTFSQFTTESNYDYVTIFDGVGTGGAVLYGPASGSPGLPTVTSTSGSLTIRFTSDGSIVAAGFTATISCVAPSYFVPSSGNNSITTCSGTIQDHAGNSDYSNNVNGYTVINPSTACSKVILTFTQFTTESGWDFVTIFDGVGTGGAILYGPNSGSPALPTITSTSGPLTIRFTSDGSIVAAGFTATISCITDVTPPSLDAITINSNCWIADDRHTYTITCQTSDPSGIGGSTYGTMALVNYQGSNAGNYGGYFAWNTSLALLNAAGYTLDQCEAAGGGFVGKANSFGQSTITLVSGSTSVSGNQRTVNFVVRPNNTFPVSTVNAISLYSGDACNNQAGWANFQLNFSSQTTQTITCPANITSCGSQVVSYSTPTATCNTTVVRNAGLASGSTFPLGVNTVTYNTYYPNGAGGYFNYAPGATNQQIALAACESVYGVGNCSIGACGSFTYYYQTGAPQCLCSKPVGSYEFIYSNTPGYTYVGEDYGGTRLDNVSGNQLFTRVKTFGGCSTGPSWTLAEPALGQGGASCSFNVNVSVMSASVGVTNVTCNGGSNGGCFCKCHGRHFAIYVFMVAGWANNGCCNGS
jgi:hypothetical protein